MWIDYATCARYQTDKNGLTVHAKGMQGSLVRYWSNLSVTVVKGPPNKKKDFKGEVHHEHYAKYLPPLEIQESKTYRWNGAELFINYNVMFFVRLNSRQYIIFRNSDWFMPSVFYSGKLVTCLYFGEHF